MLVLSLFPGIGLLDRAFEEEGFCVVRGPDVLWGGDVRRFHPPAGVFAGVIGGPPCQAFVPFANLNRARWGESSVGANLIPEFERVIKEAAPGWFVMENSRFAPELSVPGYSIHAQILNNRWLAPDGESVGPEQSRERRISFGTRSGAKLLVDVAPLLNPVNEYAVTRDGAGGWMKQDRGGTLRPDTTIERRKSAQKRTVADMCVLQGFPPDLLDEAPFTSEGKKLVIGNGVPLPMGRAIARAVKRALGAEREAA